MVSARFQELRDEALAVVDEEFAEPVQIIYMKDREPDQNRPSVEIEAILRTNEELATPITAGKDKTWSSEVAAHGSDLAIDRAAYPDIILQKGDKIRALSRPYKPWFAVLFVDDRSHRRLIVKLGVAG